MAYALTRSKDCVVAGLIAMVIVAILPLFGVLAFALRPVLVVAAIVVFIATPLLCASSGRVREWVDAQTGDEIGYRGLRLAPGFSFLPTHSWARINDVVIVGADDLVQAALGPIEAVELPAAGQHVRRGDWLFRLQHANRSVDVRSPVSGTVLAANDELRSRPELVNERPFGRGWAVRIREDEPKDRADLLRGRRARAWFRHDVDAIAEALPEHEAEIVLPPGAEREAGELHRHLDDDAWQRVKQTLFAPPHQAEREDRT